MKSWLNQSLPIMPEKRGEQCSEWNVTAKGHTCAPVKLGLRQAELLLFKPCKDFRSEPSNTTSLLNASTYSPVINSSHSSMPPNVSRKQRPMDWESERHRSQRVAQHLLLSSRRGELSWKIFTNYPLPFSVGIPDESPLRMCRMLLHARRENNYVCRKPGVNKGK